MDAVAPGTVPIQNNPNEIPAFLDKKGMLVVELVTFVALIFFTGLSIIGVPLLLIFSQEIEDKIARIWCDLTKTEDPIIPQTIKDTEALHFEKYSSEYREFEDHARKSSQKKKDVVVNLADSQPDEEAYMLEKFSGILKENEIEHQSNKTKS